MRSLFMLCFCFLVLCSCLFSGRNTVCLADTVALASGPARGPSGTPSISIQKDAFDFGEVIETEPISHDFIVKNDSKAELHVRDVSPS